MRAGIVLAAGASTRLATPKALLDVDGEPAVQRVQRVLAEAGCDPVAVVVGADADAVSRAVGPPARVVANPAWPRGRSGSLKAGLAAVPEGADVCVWPVDHPAARAVTARRLLDAPGAIRVPTYRARRGHPVVFAAALRPELLALADDEPLHHVVHRDPTRVAEVPVDDPGILVNVDRPEDLHRLRQALRGA